MARPNGVVVVSDPLLKVVELARFATPETEAKLIEWAKGVLPSAVRHKADLAVKSSVEDIQLQ